MGGNEALTAPWDDVVVHRPGRRGRLNLRSSQRLWELRRRFLIERLPRIERACAPRVRPQLVRVPAGWVAAILWDELARRDVTEAFTDWLLGQLGRDPSVGAFQVTGGTGRSVAQFLAQHADRSLDLIEASPAEWRQRLLDFDLATRVVIGRCQQVIHHWQEAGHDPLTPGGLGPHRVTPLQLVGTLYSQGLGTPKAAPRANSRGAQIAVFARQIDELAGWSNPPVNCT